jgi:hypothetical protein
MQAEHGEERAGGQRFGPLQWGGRRLSVVACIVATLVACTWVKGVFAQTQDSPCIPTVALEGDSDLVDGVRAYLAARGIPTGGTSRCGIFVVTLSAEEGKIRVLVSDTSGADDARLVTDTATASVFVESRVRSDLALVFPEPDDQPGRERAPVRPRFSEERTPGTVPAGRSIVPVTFRLRPGASVATDGSTWLDVAASGCVQIDPLCVGVTLRGSLDLGLSGRSAELQTERGGVDVLVTGEVPISVGSSLHVAPGLGIGAGWLRAGPTGSAEGPPGSEVAVDFGGLRLEPFVRVSWNIADRWALGAVAFAVIDPLAHTRDVRDPEALLAGNPAVRIGPALELAYGAP